MIAIARAAVVLVWLATSLYVFVFIGAGLLLGSAMAGSVVLALIGIVIVGALGFGWWKITTLIAVKLGVRDTTGP
jgi:hypothetical protein